jgi:DNA-binding SARP family transcriptional activator/tetratricopeptide (TPR) repeat protein
LTPCAVAGRLTEVSVAALQVQVLGPLSVHRDGEPVRLPQSKKTRGLLAYLAITGRAHRRDRLCSLLWDVADDPRGALRWSLSKIRPVVDTEAKRRLVADRESVELDLEEASLDWCWVRKELASGVDSISTERLRELESKFEGELLEGLELIDFDEFTAWCAAEREHARGMHIKVLQTLVERLASTPSDALPYARELVRTDPINEDARASLIRLLALAGRRNEAKAQYESAGRMLKELGTKATGPLETAWREANQRADRQGENRPAPSAVPARSAEAVAASSPVSPRQQDVFVGRQEERHRLVSLLDNSSEERLTVFMLKGESGIGKTRLLAELSDEARRRGCTVFEASAYEAETGRPYGPWIDALRRLPADVVSEADGAALSPLLPELGDASENAPSRDRLFGAVVDLVAIRARPEAPALLLFDDIHWCDDATSELLHYVARMSVNRPVAIVFGARDGELIDNESAMRMLRSFRRDGVIDEHLLLPLSEKDVEELVRSIHGSADAAEVFNLSGGNALMARELAHASSAGEAVPGSLRELITDRIERLAPESRNALRWGAVLGPTFDIARLTELVSLEFDPLMNALAELERRALLESTGASAEMYAFHHALVHQVVYSQISEPRRKLMHRRIAQFLDGRDDPDGAISLELAHHASVGGDAAMAVRACVAAGSRCLRVFANAEAYTHARRGLRLVEELPDPGRVRLRMELEQISLGARWPEDPEGESGRIEALAEAALDAGCPEHARLGFTLVSTLRWHEGALGDAHRLSLRAELASRGTDDHNRAVGIAETARCLVILERDLAQAEALLLEARALTERSGEAEWAVFDGVGLLRLHAGALHEAKAAFEEAWVLAKKQGNRLQEFMALEHLVMVSIHRRDPDEACEYAKELAEIGEKLREGSERPLGRAMLALCRYQKGEAEHRSALEDALQELRDVDAKQRLAFVLTQAAAIESERGELESAATRAGEAEAIGRILQQPSESALARAVLLRIAREQGDEAAMREYAKELRALSGYAKHVGAIVERELAASAAASGTRQRDLEAE